MPFIYAWTIVQRFHTLFAKSVAEYSVKFISKCCQIVIFELWGLYVSEAFVLHQLQCYIRDRLLFEYFPRYCRVPAA